MYVYEMAFLEGGYNKNMIFVCGIHGVGKTQYCEMLSKKYKKNTYSASNLILEAGKQNFTQKRVKDIDFNQSLLIQKVREMKSMGMDFILDGHLSLLDKTGAIHLIDEKVIQSLEIDLLIVLVEKPYIIQKRIQSRDGILWDEQFIDQFQQKEVEYARQLGLKLRLDYKIVTLPNVDDINFGKSLILSIKPAYAEKILSGEKKYEFRKKLCRENIDKIYLYATSPVKKIVGEVEVLERCFMEKDKLWEGAQKWAGITVDFYKQYFQKQAYAGAYGLGETIRYENPLELASLGINFVPQSYAYIDTLTL